MQVEKQFIEQLQAALKHFFGEDAQQSDSYGRIIANRHWKRITSLIQPESVICGGKAVEDDLYIEPTIVRATASDPIMQDEIFGPVLPILTIPNIETAIDFINQRYAIRLLALEHTQHLLTLHESPVARSHWLCMYSRATKRLLIAFSTIPLLAHLYRMIR
jgi:acyl-CoA reductase-like NAD-dependent aldehyde dehydrogenase